MNHAIEERKPRSYTKTSTNIEACERKSMAKQELVPLGSGKMRSNNGQNFYLVYLWATQEEYETASRAETDDTQAMCVTDTWLDDLSGKHCVQDKLGELHFVSGTWNVNTVAHEVQHGVIHRMRYLDPAPALIFDDMSPDFDPEDEEVIAYECGSWVEAVMAWLTNTDPKSPYPKHLFDR